MSKEIDKLYQAAHQDYLDRQEQAISAIELAEIYIKYREDIIDSGIKTREEIIEELDKAIEFIKEREK